LHFVGDADASVCPDVLVDFSEIPGREDDLPCNAGQSFSNVGSEAAAFTFQLLEDFGDPRSVFLAQILFAATVEAAILVGNGSNVDPRFLAAAAWAIKFVGADVDERVGVAVIGMLEDENVFAAGVRAGEAKGQFVGFTSGIDEEADTQGRGQKSDETLGVVIGVVVEVAGVGVEGGELALNGADNTGMRVADKGDVIVDVEEGAANVVEQVLAPAADDFERKAVGDAEIFAEEGAARGQCFVQGRRGLRQASIRNAKDEIGIRREAGPDETFRGEGNARKIGGAIEKVENDLKVEMRGPAAIFSCVADVCEDFATGNALVALEGRESFGGQMAVEGEEVEAGERVVVKDDNRTKVERCAIVREGMDGGGERRANRRARCHEEIDTEMDSAAFGERVAVAAKQWRGIKGTGLIVAADTDSRICSAKDGLKFLGKSRFGEFNGIGRKKRAGDAEIQELGISVADILRDQGSCVGHIGGQPFLNAGRLRDGAKATCHA
jgi:hypothetical protein